MFDRVLALFKNLRCLQFQASSEWHLQDNERLSIDQQPPTIFSTNLMELHINVNYFSDCLYLLDGRFHQLRIFHVTILFFMNQFKGIIKKVC